MMKWVRPLVTVIFVLGIFIGFLLGKIGPEAFLTIASGTIVFWYKSRDEEKKKSE